MVALFDLSRARADELRRWQTVFERDRNKAAAWRCYRLARLWDLPIPLSVLAELDRISAAFEAAVEHARAFQSNPSRPKAPKRLGSENVGRIITESGQGAADPATSLLAWERDFEIASAVESLRLGGWTEAAAVERVASGTDDLAWAPRVVNDTVVFRPVPTPARSSELIRRAVRRVKKLSTDTTDLPDLNNMTKAANDR